MVTQSFFRIENDSPNKVVLYVEPEGAAFPLGAGEQVLVFDVYTKSPVTLRFSKSDEGDACISVWPGDGEVRVEKDGVNLHDLM